MEQVHQVHFAQSTIGKALVRFNVPLPKERRELEQIHQKDEQGLNDDLSSGQMTTTKSDGEQPVSFTLTNEHIKALKSFVGFFYDQCARVKLEDPRTGNAIVHRLENVLLFAFAACLAGQNKFQDITRFCQENEKFFRSFMDLSQTMPEKDTYIRGL